MNHTKKVFIIIGSCILTVALICGIIMYRTFLVSQGQPYEQISMDQAAEYMKYEEGYILLDVRTKEEYDEGHIPGAVCIPLEELQERAEEELEDKDQMIYVYCRSGNRSKKAAKKLCNMGYTNITEIGGISDWTGALEKCSCFFMI
ncbi:MAG: rhodanese-like domain-containing protein [Lachnospiraceae bacterium]|nr:rhodanese-like domain-containing protein [Lachnospiraceae bacterium]